MLVTAPRTTGPRVLRGAHGRTGAGVTLAVALPLGLAAVIGGGHAPVLLDQGAGTAWVVSPTRGLVTLIDGTSAAVVASVRVGGAGHDLTVAQARGGSYLVDADAGAVTRLDAATLAAGAPVAAGTPDGGVTLLQNDRAGGHVVHVLDPTARTATRRDPRTLAVLDEVRLAARPGPGQAVVADDGALWALDARTGTLTHVPRRDDGGAAGGAAAPADRTVRPTAAATRTARLVLVQGDPVVVDTARGALRRVGPDGLPGAPGCLDTRSDDDVRLLGSATRPEVYVAVEEARTLLVAPVDGEGCGRTVDLGDTGTAPDDDVEARYGELVQSGRFVLVPDRATGTAAVVDTTTATVLDRVTLAPPGHRVELRAHDTFVFFNDLDGHSAGVLRFAAGRWTAQAVEKYDPGTGRGTEVVVPPDQRSAAVLTSPDGADDPGPRDDPDPRDGTADRAADVADGVTPDRPTDPLPRPGSVTPSPAGPSPGAGPGAPTRPTPTPTPTVSPSPTADPPLTVRLTAEPPASGRAEFEPHTEAVVVPTVTGAGPDATWDWSVVSSAGDERYTAPDPGRPLVLESVGTGDLTVYLTVTGADGVAVTAELRLVVSYGCHLVVGQPGTGDDGIVDLRASSRGAFAVSAVDCRGPQTADLTLPTWLSGPSRVTVAGDGSPTFVELTLVGTPPGDGPQPGVVLSFSPNGSTNTYPITVLTDVPPEVVTAGYCELRRTVPGPLGPDLYEWRTATRVVVVDAVRGDLQPYAVVADNGVVVPEVDGDGDRTLFQHGEVVVVPDESRPIPPAPTSVEVVDGFGKRVTAPVQLLSGATPCNSW